jgi:hypothetical protein
VASGEALTLFYRAMRLVMYRSTATAIEMANGLCVFFIIVVLPATLVAA